MGKVIMAGIRSDVPPGKMIAVKLEGRGVLLGNIDGRIYAIDNKCPHMGGNLSRGMLIGTIVTCPLHGSQFDIITGKNIRWLKGSGLLHSVGSALKAKRDAVKYNVNLDGDKILVEI